MNGPFDDEDESLGEFLAAYDDALAAGATPDLTGPVPAGLEESFRELLPLLDHLNRFRPPAAEAAPGGSPWVGLEARLRRFHLQRCLGQGGFGVVYLAYDTLLGREVALKLPRLDTLLSPERRAEFLHEARVAARLDHPHLVPIHDAGFEGGVSYLVSAYYPGPTLAAWLREQKTPVPCETAAQLVLALANAVEYTHDQGVLHRDIKPSNILLVCGEQGADATRPLTRLGSPLHPKLTDFGLAKLREAGKDWSHSGTSLGTPGYTAPEQVLGQPVGAAADIYALGAVLYELLTRCTPSAETMEQEILRQIRNEEPAAPRSLRAEIPRDLETICLKCLRQEPANRYPSAGALAEDLRRWLAGEPIQARPAGRSERCWRQVRRHPLAVTLLACGFLVALVVAAGALWQQHAAQREALKLRRVLYDKKIPEAERAWTAGNVLACRDLLNELRPAPGQPDLRGFEWHYLWHQYEQDGLRLTGHEGSVEAVAYSPDGRTLATASEDRTVRLWDPATGELRWTLRGHTDRLLALAFTPDGQTLASAGDDHVIKLWDPRTGRERASLSGHEQRIGSLAISGDGRFLASGGDDQRVRLWDLDALPQSLLDLRQTFPISAMAFAPDHALLAVSHNSQIGLWDIPSGRQRILLPGHYTHVVTSLAFSANGRLLASGAEENTVKFWDTRSWNVDSTLPGPGETVRRMSFSPDGRTLAVCGEPRPKMSRILHLYDLSEGIPGRPWATLDDKDGSILPVAFAPDGRTLAVGTSTGRVRLWQPRRPEEQPRPISHAPAEAWCVAFSPDGKTLVSGGDNKDSAAALRLTDVATHKTLWTGTAHDALVTGVAFSPDGRVIASCSYDQTVKLWDPADGTVLGTLGPHADRLRCLAFSPDGQLLAVAGKEHVITLWDLRTRQIVRTLAGHGDGYIRGLAFLPGGHRLVSVSEDRTLRLWMVATGREIATFRNTDEIGGVAVAPDGKLAAFGDGEGRVQLFDLAARQPRTLLGGNHGKVRAVAFSPDGRTLASAGDDKVIRLWDPATGAELLTLRGHEQAINALAFSLTGTSLASAGHDGVIQLWRAADQ